MDRLNGLDASFLYLEKPNVHMHIAGLAIFDPANTPDGEVSFQKVAELLSRRVHEVPRFRQRIHFVPLDIGRPVWADDPTFDLSYHLRRAALPPPGGPRELADFVQRVCSAPLDRSKPLWEMYIIEGLEDDHVATLTKVHHSMMDGITGMQVAGILLDFDPEPRAVEPDDWHPEPEPSGLKLVASALLEQGSRFVRAAIEAPVAALRAPQTTLHEIVGVVSSFPNLVRGTLGEPGPFNVAIGPNRRFAMADMPVSEAKAVKNALGGTVTDVILTVVAGALGDLFRARGLETAGVDVRAMVPTSTRAEGDSSGGNLVSSMFVDLPVGPMAETDRFVMIGEETRRLKTSQVDEGVSRLLDLVEWTPPTLHRLTAERAGRQRVGNLVVSSIPGPQEPMYFAGARLVAYHPVLPISESTALSIAVTSLSGTMGFGFTADWDAVPDIDLLSQGVVESFAELKKAVGV
ncbi:MAG TPA: wax ester/triacylglycerol synthase family O-acyltransferase [Actinomycetota bacterium]|nr:wax ester/triacylglycerol synthase family O-acyltransferase [Actinomycetota bacterium]